MMTVVKAATDLTELLYTGVDVGPRFCPVKQPHVALGETQGSGWDMGGWELGAQFLEGSQQAGATRGSLGASPPLSPLSRPSHLRL